MQGINSKSQLNQMMASILQNLNYCAIRGYKWLLLVQNQYQKNKAFLNLSKETEDNLNTELFSEIFSKSINNVSIQRIRASLTMIGLIL